MYVGKKRLDALVEKFVKERSPSPHFRPPLAHGDDLTGLQFGPSQFDCGGE
jgi:hypothetical protein